jgi:hypothetical protein
MKVQVPEAYIPEVQASSRQELKSDVLALLAKGKKPYEIASKIAEVGWSHGFSD